MEKITDKYYLGSNKTTYVLYEKKISSSGKETYKNIGYLATLDAVYTTLIEKEIRDDLTLVNNVGKIRDMIKELKNFTIEYVNKNNEEGGT